MKQTTISAALTVALSAAFALSTGGEEALPFPVTRSASTAGLTPLQGQ